MGALSGGPKVKSSKKTREVTPTKKGTLQTVSNKATGCLKGKSRKRLLPSQESPQQSLESIKEPCLASTPVHSPYCDRVPKILQSPIRVNQETKQAAIALTPLKVFNQILQLLFLIGLKMSPRYSDFHMVPCPCAETRDWITMLQANNEEQAQKNRWSTAKTSFKTADESKGKRLQWNQSCSCCGSSWQEAQVGHSGHC